MTRGEAVPGLDVGQLLDCLRMFAVGTPVVAVYDGGTAEGSIVRVEIGPGADSEPESIILVVE